MREDGNVWPVLSLPPPISSPHSLHITPYTVSFTAFTVIFFLLFLPNVSMRLHLQAIRSMDEVCHA